MQSSSEAFMPAFASAWRDARRASVTPVSPSDTQCRVLIPERGVIHSSEVSMIDDLSAIMDTPDEWITPRSGIKTRHWVSEGETGVTLARRASLQALAKAGMKASELDCIVYCTCTPDHFEPGNGVFLQRELGISDIPAIDVRNQCSGFVYGLSVADAWIRVGQYRRVLLVGAEVHSRGRDRTTRGRDTAVLFGDGAGVAIRGPNDEPGSGPPRPRAARAGTGPPGSTRAARGRGGA